MMGALKINLVFYAFSVNSIVCNNLAKLLLKIIVGIIRHMK